MIPVQWKSNNTITEFETKQKNTMKDNLTWLNDYNRF